MAGSHYTRQELFILRNHIPIDSLIAELGIPSRMIEGYFRFCCPVCDEFNTAVNPQTNLARCFACRKNYNPIDLVMIVKGLDFIHSVKFLQKYRNSKKSPSSSPPSLERPLSGMPVSIGKIFKTMETAGGSEPKKQHANTNHSYNQLHERINQLEQTVEQLIQKIRAIDQKN